MNACKEDDLLKCQAIEKRQLPKRIRAEMKTRELMFRESLRISVVSESPEEERDKIKKVINFIFLKMLLHFLDVCTYIKKSKRFLYIVKSFGKILVHILIFIFKKVIIFIYFYFKIFFAFLECVCICQKVRDSCV